MSCIVPKGKSIKMPYLDNTKCSYTCRQKKPFQNRKGKRGGGKRPVLGSCIFSQQAFKIDS